MKILVVGGAGYIGAHMVKWLSRAGHEVVVLDNLSTGHRHAARYGMLIEADLADASSLERVLRDHRFDAVMHFAAFSLVGESMTDPGKYYRNNVAGTLNLLDAMVQNEVRHFIFSSTAATFGEPQADRIDVWHPQFPINPYGQSKLMVERVLDDYDRAHGLKSACLRYFNAAGADPEGELGECHDPETHLIPLVLQVASGRREKISVFGDDYDTPDGSCIRDYIHVQDLCDAHLRALEWMRAYDSSGRFNLGNGSGFSVFEVIDSVRRITGRDIACEVAPRRPGDPARLVADATLAKMELNWRPQFSDLDKIVAHAWNWEQRLAHKCG